jgi:hypothetical protein
MKCITFLWLNKGTKVLGWGLRWVDSSNWTSKYVKLHKSNEKDD